METNTSSNANRLFYGSCFALITTAFSFAIAAGILDQLIEELELTASQGGLITSMWFAGFPISMVIGGLIYHKVGGKVIMQFAFFAHAIGILLLIFSGSYMLLLVANLLIGLGNGCTEAACNPMIADAYQGNRMSKMLNRFHMWFPGGIAVGILLSGLMEQLGIIGQDQVWLLLIPAIIYAYLFFGQNWPKAKIQEAATLGGNLKAMVTPLFLFIAVCMALTAISEFGPNQWVGLILEKSGANTYLILALTAGLMAVARFFGGDMVAKFNQTGVLLGSAVLATIGINADAEVLNNGNRLSVVDENDDSIFEVQLTPATGQWEFFQYQDIAGLDSDIPIGLLVTDADGDSSSINLNIEFLTTAEFNARDDAYTTSEDTPIIMDVLQNDSNGAEIVAGSVELKSGEGSVVLNSNGTITFNPNTDFSGKAEISYEVEDGSGNKDTALVNVVVEAVADKPDLIVTLGDATNTGSLSYTADDISGLGDLGTGDINDGTDFTVSATTRTLSFGSENAGEAVSISFDALVKGSWDLDTFNSRADTFKISANDALLATNTYSLESTGSSLNESYVYTATLDQNGDIELEFAVDSTHSAELVDVSEIKVELDAGSSTVLYPLEINGIENDIDAGV